jgi:hypothetical protein
MGVEDVDVDGTTDLTVLVTVCVTFWTVDWTGLVVGVVVAGFGAGAGAVVGVVVGTGDVAAPAGMKPTTDPAASNTPDVATPAAAKRRFRLIFSRSILCVRATQILCGGYTHRTRSESASALPIPMATSEQARISRVS